MGRHIFLSVLGFSVLAVIIGVFVMPGKTPRAVHLPWQITVTEEGNLRVLGVELGRTTLGGAELAFGEPAEVSLFSEEGERMVEAYFDQVDISGLRAKIVVVIPLSDEVVEAMYERGVRVANMGGGRRKVTLADADLAQLKQMPIGSMTYIPRANLDAELVSRRFGEPAERIGEPEGKTVHWLYPEKGLDIALNPEETEVLQYVRPEEFARISAPLKALAKEGQDDSGELTEE
ncbi:MAG: hypothetical protein R6X15_07560 [Pseudomonadota bacterium]